MPIWVKVAAEVLLALIVFIVSGLFWAASDEPRLFKKGLKDARFMRGLLTDLQKPGGTALLRPEWEPFEREISNREENIVFPMVLSSYVQAAFATWRKTTIFFFLLVALTILGGAFLSWICALINLAVFLVSRSGRVSGKSQSMLADVVRSVGVVIMIVFEWQKADPERSEEFCTMLSPQFSTVFEVVSGFGRSSA
jgi:hypothetical protein